MSINLKEIFVFCFLQFCFATDIASLLMSQASIKQSSKNFDKEIAIHPEPVPISNIFLFFGLPSEPSLPILLFQVLELTHLNLH